MSQTIEYGSLLNRLFELDHNIRFAAVTNKSGEILAKGSKSNTELFLSPEETQETIHHAINAWKSREKHYEKIGEGLYTLAVVIIGEIGGPQEVEAAMWSKENMTKPVIG